MIVSLIVAVANRRVIGFKNSLPWKKMKADMKRFRRLTLGKPVIMGRKTFESIRGSLEGRTNIVLTHNLKYKAKGCIVAHSMNEALDVAKKTKTKETMVIGGSSVFSLFLPLAGRIYLTRIYAELPGDAYFPELNIDNWLIKEQADYPNDKNNPYPCSFLVLERKKGG